MDVFFYSEFWCQLLSKTFLLVLLGTAYVATQRAGFINLGISAQLVLSAMVMSYCAAYTRSAPISICAGFGISWAMGASASQLRYRYGVSEILSTLFMTLLTLPLCQLILRLTGSTTTLATPAVPPDASIDILKLPGLSLAAGGDINMIHLMAPVGVIMLGLFNTYTVWGLKSIAAGNNPKVLTAQETISLHRVLHAVASAAIVLYVLADMYISQGKYIAGDYDNSGFTAITVGLLCFGRALYLIPAAMFVAGVEMIFLAMNVGGYPPMASRILYGVILVCAAFVLKKRGEK